MKKSLLLFIAILHSLSFSQSKVDTILSQMTLEEKIGQMILVYHSHYSFLEDYRVGSVLIMQNMLKKPHKLVKNLEYAQRKLPIPLLVTIDQEGGKINRLKKIPGWNNLPSATTISKWDTLKIERYAYKVGKKLKSLGVNTNLAPVLDPSHDQFGNPTFMNETRRSFGSHEDSILNSASAFIRGMERAGILCISKHYPGYDAHSNSDHAITVSMADSQYVYNNMTIFNKSMHQVAGVMINSIHYPSLCDKPSVFCPQIVDKIREADDDKLIMTDDLWGASLRSYISNVKQVHNTRYPKSDLIKLIENTFLAGNDVLMTTYPKTVPVMINTIKNLALSDSTYIEQINASARRILLAKQKINLLDNVDLPAWREKSKAQASSSTK